MGFNTVIIVLALGSALVAAVAIVFLLRGPWFWGWLKGSLGITGLLAAAYFIFMSISLVYYQPLLERQAVATVSFQQQTADSYLVSVTAAQGGQPLTYSLKGDFWQLSVRGLIWQEPLALLSPDQGYQLLSIQSRYLSLEQARLNKTSQHDLLPVSLLLDAWRQGSIVSKLVTEEKIYQSPFLPMADGALFKVVWQDGRLVGEPLNGVAEEVMLN